MKTKKLLALLMAIVMVVGLVACGGSSSSGTQSGGSTATTQPSTGGSTTEPTTDPAASAEPALKLGYDLETGTTAYGPYYDEWSDMTDEELYEMALKEDTVLNIYATSSKMLKEEELFEQAYPGLDVVISDLDSDEVLNKARIENETGNITADVLQTKDVSGDVFHEWYSKGIIEPFYPRDICSHIDEGNLKYSYPLYTSMSFWFYNTEAFPDGQPIESWWQIIEKDESGKQRFRLFTKEIGQESTYLSLFASFINNADQMEADYKRIYGTDLEYTYDASKFEFEVPENNAGVEYLWRFTQADITFIGDGDDLVLAVHNSTKDDPALCLASAGKISHQEESGYNIGWCINLTPYNALLNTESLFVVQGTNSPAGARLFIRFITGGADGESGGLKPWIKLGNWLLRDDVKDKKNPAPLNELGAVPNNLSEIYYVFLDVQDMWTYWLNQKK